MTAWKIILAAVVIFGAGVLTGGLLVGHVKDKWPGRAEAHSREANSRPPEVPLPRQADRLSKEFVRRLNDSLQLNPAQREAIAKIVADGQERNHVIWTNAAPQMRKVMQEVDQQIRAELTPEQVKQFEELMKQFRPGGHRPPPPPPTNPPPGV